MKWQHLFLPHSETHRPAFLISKAALLLYIFFFLIFNLSISFVQKANPTILGISADLNQQELIRLTNMERQKAGLNALTEDPRLNVAASEKARNMFEENYWAHYSPSGKDPWEFIIGAGYKFSYAGENLARNFYSSSDVVVAWMASPTHKDNVINANYQNIGMAIAEGTLDGKPTVLVVQEFGSPVEYIAQGSPFKNSPTQSPTTLAQASISPKPTSTPEVAGTPAPEVSETPEPTSNPIALARLENNTPAASAQPNFPTTVAGQRAFAIDPYLLMKNIGISLLTLLMFLIALDLYIIRRRAVVRLTSHHWPHLAILFLALSVLVNLGRGAVL